MDNLNITDDDDGLSSNNSDLSDAEIKEMFQRKEDYLSGKVKAIPWSKIKKRYSKSETAKPSLTPLKTIKS